MYEQLQLDMKNFTNPLNKITLLDQAIAKIGENSRNEYQLQPNEFTDQTDLIGFFKLDQDPDKFLSVNQFKTQITSSNVRQAVTLDMREDPEIEEKSSENQIALPGLEIRITLSDQMMTAERSQYTFFTLLGDLGGFNGAIIIFPAYIMSIYSSKMYQQDVTAQTSVRRRRKKSNSAIYKLPDQVLTGEQKIDQPSINGIFNQVRLISRN